MHSVNKVDENIKKIGALFPGCVTERKSDAGEVEYAVDFDMLRQELSSVVVEGPEERYQFTWPDKKKSVLLANSPISETLRPCREESVGKDGTAGGFDSENLYIEGDNLDVLKLLQETYLGKIKMIYIDPPYNTGNDFVYEDDFAQSTEEYLSNSGQFDAEGNRLVTNTESNGRFHTDWLNMLYPRLKVAKDLLTDDGVIFISIDENEVVNLKNAANDVFGEINFITSVIWEKKYAPANDAKWLSDTHDYILVYAKSKELWHPELLPRSDEMNSRYTNRDNDPRGPWKAADMTVKSYSAAYDYPITTPSGKIVYPSAGRCWNTSKENVEKLIKNNRIWFGETGSNVPAVKKFLSEVKSGTVPTTIWKYTEVGHNQEGRQEVKKLFNDKGYFDGPKPVRLLMRILQIANLNSDSIILDFFSGSATTAHAAMQLNAEDGGHRKFIMVQLPEETDEKSEAHKAGYKNICEIGKERIRRAGKKIKEENPLTTQDLDIGFRVLKLDSSNMEEVYYTPDQTTQSFLERLEDNIKADRSPEDLLFQVMLDLGVLPSSKIEQSEISGKKVFNVADNFLIACFDKNVTDEVIAQVAKLKPYYFVMRDSSMADDSVSTNFDQIFETYSPDTVRKVL